MGERDEQSPEWTPKEAGGGGQAKERVSVHVHLLVVAFSWGPGMSGPDTAIRSPNTSHGGLCVQQLACLASRLDLHSNFKCILLFVQKRRIKMKALLGHRRGGGEAFRVPRLHWSGEKWALDQAFNCIYLYVSLLFMANDTGFFIFSNDKVSP